MNNLELYPSNVCPNTYFTLKGLKSPDPDTPKFGQVIIVGSLNKHVYWCHKGKFIHNLKKKKHAGKLNETVLLLILPEA